MQEELLRVRLDTLTASRLNAAVAPNHFVRGKPTHRTTSHLFKHYKDPYYTSSFHLSEDKMTRKNDDEIEL